VSSVLPGVKKIAVFRATALGDFIMAVPALRALHETYPDAEIVYLGRSWHQMYLPGRLPGIGRVLEIPPPQGEDIARGEVIDARFYDDFVLQMQAEQFDLAVQLHGGGMKSNPFIYDFHARFTIGTRAPGAFPLQRWIPYVYAQHETIRCLEVVSLAGAFSSLTNLLPELPVFATDLNKAQTIFDRLRSRSYVVIHAGATDPRRRWHAHQFAAIADYCSQRLQMDIVLTGTSIDAQPAAAVEAAMHTIPVNTVNQLSLQGLTGLLSKAALVISNDSGPMHLAYALGTKTVGLFTAEYVIPFLPLLRQHFTPLIAWDRRCPQCGTFCEKQELDHPSGSCQHLVSFVDQIPVEVVLDAIHELLH
jgi:ADP-heptose:LPS heptosyltransferase